MAFTATIQGIQFQNDQFMVSVVFNDSVSGWASTKTYNFLPTATQAEAVARITADGTNYKADLVKNASLQSKVGTIITI